MNEIETLKKWLDESCHIVFFGGAGVSTQICMLAHRFERD